MSDVLLRDLIDIPEDVHRADFVISLASGVRHPERTIEQYVVTPDLVDRFDAALGLIASAVDSGRSTGAYLHGSFGSGKSHFMAVLHLLLEGHPDARAIPQLAPVVAKHDPRLSGRRVLLVPFNMIGAQSMEQRIFDGYVSHVRGLHPDAKLPGLYIADDLVDNAVRLRAQMGADRFFAELAGSADDEFGDLAGGWDSASFEQAVAAPPGAEARQRLVSDLITTFFPSAVATTAATGRGYVDFDDGLAAMSRHAKDLGYDAVVLFIDELVLWFATRMADPTFVQTEGPKVARLVETGRAERPVPLVSFIARQRDLREFVGEGLPGAEQLNFSDILKYWEGRFDTIELPDKALPAIVEKRLLQPRTEAARQRLDDAFEAVAASAAQVLDTLVTREGDREMFRRVYPFSPALVETLVAVSTYLQRERTALLLLQQLLVDQRHRLTVGDLVPLGDLYDVIAAAGDPFSTELRRHFDAARRLYRQRLRPLLLDEHGLGDDQVRDLDDQHPFRTDDRLVKTLLLAALVPEVEPVRGLTVRRLVALNHGTVRTPIKGQERAAVLAKLKRWQAVLGELRLEGDDQDPTVTLQLTGVDTRAILDRARDVDNVGSRRRKLRELLADAVGLGDLDAVGPAVHDWVWRGSRRRVEVLFANVRDQTDIPDTQFRAGDVPRVVVDFPFDDPGYGPADDLARVDDLRSAVGPTATLCWVPRSLTERALEKLGELVIMDHVLAGDRFEGVTTHLSPQDRSDARQQLRSQADALRGQLRDVPRQAYGLDTPDPGWVQTDPPLRDQFPTLDPTLDVRPPTAASLRDAFEELLDQLMTSLFPAHPRFEEEVRVGDLRTALRWVQEAVEQPHGRVDGIPTGDRRAVRKVLGPLQVAETGEAHITLKRHWPDHIRQRLRPGEPVTVERVKAWIDQPEPMGLDDRVANLVVCTLALQDGRILAEAGQPIDLTVDRLDPAVELRTTTLPTEHEWRAATERGAALFGVTASPLLTPTTVATFVGQVRQRAREQVGDARRLASTLEAHATRLGTGLDATRLRTARAAHELLDTVLSADQDHDVVRAIAEADLPTSAEAAARSTATAAAVSAKLESTNWPLIARASELTGGWEADARSIRTRLTDAGQTDELAAPLVGALLQAEAAATDLLSHAARGPVAEPPTPAPHRPPATPPTGLPTRGERRELAGTDARALLEALLAHADDIETLDVTWTLRS